MPTVASLSDSRSVYVWDIRCIPRLVLSAWIMVEGQGFKVEGLGFKVWGLGFKV